MFFCGPWRPSLQTSDARLGNKDAFPLRETTGKLSLLYKWSKTEKKKFFFWNSIKI